MILQLVHKTVHNHVILIDFKVLFIPDCFNRMLALILHKNFCVHCHKTLTSLVLISLYVTWSDKTSLIAIKVLS